MIHFNDIEENQKRNAGMLSAREKLPVSGYRHNKRTYRIVMYFNTPKFALR